MNGKRRLGPAGLGLLALVVGQAGAETAPMAVTFDDLPLQGPDGWEVSDIFRINERLVAALDARDIPAVGFVNERKLERSGRAEAALIGALEFGELADELEAGGRTFVSVEAALADPAYDSADEWTGSGGISWLHRWALTKGMPKAFYQGEPEVPAWVMKLANINSE